MILPAKQGPRESGVAHGRRLPGRANLDQGDPDILLKSVARLYRFLLGEQKAPISDRPRRRNRMSISPSKRTHIRLDPEAYQQLCRQVMR